MNTDRVADNHAQCEVGSPVETIDSPAQAAAGLPDPTAPLRNTVFDDLDTAESMVVHLLDIAASTAEHLSSMAVISPRSPHGHMEDKLKKNGKDYLDTIKKIHSLLLPHAYMVKAYETDPNLGKEAASTDTDLIQCDNNIYVSKMELRLAREKQSLIEDFIQLEHETQSAALVSSSDINLPTTNSSILGKRKNTD